MNEEMSFPKNFLWGAATSAHQVEGDNRQNDWWEWEQKGKVKEPSQAACDHWRLFRKDFALARSLGHNAHRFSVEWSRIEPREGVFDEEALKHYDDVIDSLRENNLEPILTLHHFTLPLWLAREGGWLSSKAPRFFARLAEKTAERWKNKVRYWMTINEPEVYVHKSYIAGDWPPGERSFLKELTAYVNLWKGHNLAYKMIHQKFGSSAVRPCVGLAKSAIVFVPFSERSILDKLSVRISDFISNHLLVRAAVHAKTLDFIGLNYYTRNFMRGFRVVEKGPSSAPKNSLGWDIYPRGLYEMTKAFSKYRMPILISENGICTLDDDQRTVFIEEHLKNLSQAMREGADVFGYLYWSLLDNFEWADGFSPRFGLVHVDYKTQQRLAKPSALRFSEIIRA